MENSFWLHLVSGKVGDWKTVFTVAQAEHFARVYQAKIQDLLSIRSASIPATKSSVTPLAATYHVDVESGEKNV